MWLCFSHSIKTRKFTQPHLFWVEDEWVTADKLKAGDVLTLADETTCAIDEVYAEFSDKAITVYNFEVADYHTYYVTYIRRNVVSV